MIFLTYAIVVLIICALLYFGIDAIIHTHKYETWVWKMMLFARIKNPETVGVKIDKLDMGKEFLDPPAELRILFTRIWGGVLVALALVTMTVLVTVIIKG